MNTPEKTNDKKRRSVVITGVGFISAMGNTPEDVRKSIVQNRIFFERPAIDSSLAVAPVTDFNVKTYTGRCKDARYLNRGAAFAVAAALMAVKQSGLEAESLENAGLFAASGPNMDISDEFKNIVDSRISEQGLSALFLLKFLPNTATSLIAQLTGVHGENMTLGSACSASLMAIGEAYRKIKDGYLDTALAGGGDSRLSPGGLLSYRKAGALWQGSEDPAAHYTPFGPNRKGFIPGEGGAFFVLESLYHAEKRNARIIGEIIGYGATLDGHAMTAPRPDGFYAERAVRKAMDEASIRHEEMDLISAHGTGTDLNDSMEAAMISRVFKNSQPGITSFKSWIGHLASACGAVELALCLACSTIGLFPCIRNLKQSIGPCLDILTTSRSMSPSHILLENFGFGGQNSALVVKPWI
jgi:3-oxoacyl-[acyl-carrier-protein] synthase II